jgi:hypothetical protein
MKSYLYLTLEDNANQTLPWGGLHITIIGYDPVNIELFNKISANFNSGSDRWTLTAGSNLRYDGNKLLFFNSEILNNFSQQLVRSGFRNVKGPVGNAASKVDWHITVVPSHANHYLNLFRTKHNFWHLTNCIENDNKFIWYKVPERKIGFDFDGVIHINVKRQDDNGSRAPTNPNSDKNECFKLICDKIKENAMLGSIIYIITARRSPESKKIIINNLRHCGIESFMIKDTNIIMLGSESKANKAKQFKLQEFYDDSMNNIEDFISNIPSIAPPFRLYKAIPEEKRIELIFEL